MLFRSPGRPVVAAPRKGAAAGGLCRGGGSPAAQGWGVRAWGLRWEVRKGVVGSNWVEEGRRRSSTGAGGRWQLGAAAAAPRRWRRDEAGPRGSSRAVWWWFGARWRREWGGGAKGRARARCARGGGCSGRLKRPRDEREEVWGPSARGIDGRPRSAARQRQQQGSGRGRQRRGRFGRHGDDGGASPSSCRLRRARRLSGAQQDDVCAQVGESAARPGGSAAAARQRGRGSGAARHARAALKCLRACRAKRGESARERRERKRSGERKENVNGLTWSKLKICN